MKNNPIHFNTYYEGEIDPLKYVVITDNMRFLERKFLKKNNEFDIILQGERGSGKTTCIGYLQKVLPKNGKNLVISLRYSVYIDSISLGLRCKHLSNIEFILISRIFEGLNNQRLSQDDEITNEKRRIRKIEHEKHLQAISLLNCDNLLNFYNITIPSMLQDLSKIYSHVIFLVDNIDKSPETYLKYSKNSKIKELFCNDAKRIKISFICTAMPSIASDIAPILSNFSNNKLIILNSYWSPFILSELVNKRIEDSSDSMVSDFFQKLEFDKILHLSEKNPRKLLHILNVLSHEYIENNKKIDYSKLVFPEFNEFEIAAKNISLGSSQKKIINKEDSFFLQLKPHWDNFSNAKSNNEKGKALENLISVLFGNLKGLKIVKRNVKRRSQEIDILVSNESKDPLLCKLSSPFPIECKNWNSPVNAEKMRWFIEKVKELNSNVGVFVAWNGITGNNGARDEIFTAQKDGITIVVMDKDNIKNIFCEQDLLIIFKECYYKAFG